MNNERERDLNYQSKIIETNDQGVIARLSTWYKGRTTNNNGCIGKYYALIQK